MFSELRARRVYFVRSVITRRNLGLRANSARLNHCFYKRIRSHECHESFCDNSQRFAAVLVKFVLIKLSTTFHWGRTPMKETGRPFQTFRCSEEYTMERQIYFPAQISGIFHCTCFKLYLLINFLSTYGLTASPSLESSTRDCLISSEQETRSMTLGTRR